MSGPPPDRLTDEQLASRAKAGCSDSFERIVRRYQQPLLHFLRQRASADEAEDLLQETFLRMHRNMHRYRDGARLRPWLLTIAHRLAVSHLRRRRLTHPGDAPAQTAASEPGPEQRAIETERRQTLWDTARRILSEAQWTALWLHYAEGMPLKEVARVVGRPAGTVRATVGRARKKLARHVEPPGEPGDSRPVTGAAVIP